MRRELIGVVVAGWVGCSGPPDAQVPPSEEVDLVQDQFGSIVFLHWAPELTAEQGLIGVQAAFAGSDGGLINPVECLITGPCLQSLPGPGETVTADAPGFEMSGTRWWVGPEVRFGPITAPVRTGLYADYEREQVQLPAEGVLAFEQGQFGDFAETVVFPPPIGEVSPDPFVLLEAGPERVLSSTFPDLGTATQGLLWTGRGWTVRGAVEGEVSFAGPDFDPPGDLFGFALALTRSTTTDLTANGNDLRVFVHSDQWWYGVYRDLEHRTPVSPTGSCEQAPVLEPGVYRGSLAGLNSDFALGDAEGADGVVAIDVPAGASLNVQMRDAFGDPVLGVFLDCFASALAISDSLIDELEVIEVNNPSEVTQRFFVVLDSFYAGDEFILDLTLE